MGRQIFEHLATCGGLVPEFVGDEVGRIVQVDEQQLAELALERPEEVPRDPSREPVGGETDEPLPIVGVGPEEVDAVSAAEHPDVGPGVHEVSARLVNRGDDF